MRRKHCKIGHLAEVGCHDTAEVFWAVQKWADPTCTKYSTTENLLDEMQGLHEIETALRACLLMGVFRLVSRYASRQL